MTVRELIAHGGPQPLPTRAAPSLVRALRVARGSPPWTPWTILCRLDRHHPSYATCIRVDGENRCDPHADPIGRVRGVITITGIGDHLRPEWPITITGMRTVHAVVVLIDEKSQTQALDRIQPGLPMKPGKCGTMTREIQVLCPMNRGGVGARSLNIELQNALNLPGDVRVDRFG
ncbi:MAG: exodeoxyribonuclease alpha subunit, partial [Alphaproteobacteria bacterium]|nr:exodeoxyribonuclease alpha subunit [Alphaproteobacteria bacterium]